MKRYFFISPSGDGWKNLATDEYFLDNLAPDDFMLYLYINERAVIIGHNQNPWTECRTEVMDKAGVQLVRRCSGGGAVYHDKGNLNFSFITGSDNYDLDRQIGIILSAVRAVGIEAEQTGRNDITVEGRKFSGNAFCARGENKQHHGTLLISADLGVMQDYLSVSREKLTSKGIKSVRSRVANLTEFTPDLTVPQMADALRKACEENLGKFEDFVMTPEAEAEIGKYYIRHSSWDWRMGKSPDFDYSTEHRFPWGGVRLCLNVKNGFVTETALFTDALDPELAVKAQNALAGARFDRGELASRLKNTENQPELFEIGQYLEFSEL